MNDSAGFDAYFAAWAGGFAIPSIVIADDLRLIWANSAAGPHLRGNVFFIADGALCCADRSQETAFREFLLALPMEPAAWALRKADNDHLIVRCEQLRVPGLPPAIGLMLHDASTVRHIWVDIGKIFGLTPAEVAIIKRMLTGASSDEIAGILNISLETVRTHVRRIYTKVGASNREQLFAIMTPYRIS